MSDQALFPSCQKQNHWPGNPHRTALPSHSSFQILKHRDKLSIDIISLGLPRELSIVRLPRPLDSTFLFGPEAPIQFLL